MYASYCILTIYWLICKAAFECFFLISFSFPVSSAHQNRCPSDLPPLTRAPLEYNSALLQTLPSLQTSGPALTILLPRHGTCKADSETVTAGQQAKTGSIFI